MSILLALSLFACKGEAYRDRGNGGDDSGSAGQNTAPLIDSVSLSPELALTADAVLATVQASDADGDTLTTTYEWTVDGAAAGTDSDTLAAELSAKGQRVVVMVTVRSEEHTS